MSGIYAARSTIAGEITILHQRLSDQSAGNTAHVGAGQRHRFVGVAALDHRLCRVGIFIPLVGENVAHDGAYHAAFYRQRAVNHTHVANLGALMRLGEQTGARPVVTAGLIHIQTADGVAVAVEIALKGEVRGIGVVCTDKPAFRAVRQVAVHHDIGGQLIIVTGGILVVHQFRQLLRRGDLVGVLLRTGAAGIAVGDAAVPADCCSRCSNRRHDCRQRQDQRQQDCQQPPGRGNRVLFHGVSSLCFHNCKPSRSPTCR